MLRLPAASIALYTGFQSGNAFLKCSCMLLVELQRIAIAPENLFFVDCKSWRNCKFTSLVQAP